MRRGGDRRFEETSPEELEECFWRAKMISDLIIARLGPGRDGIAT
ncbi:hypothetical protein ABID19_006557 [Mesorhizobium robiniae]|uniref:Uncharacterized protein n=1 Tax=Mesorhizobium robiniae TaxID=559315 RepID=A0ABV2GZM3_9HYPH